MQRRVQEPSNERHQHKINEKERARPQVIY